uniref:Putative helicase n=1 Tax=viral metagenome TaxID=1070528 RepID=A0A6M3K230_9ZZZZ
MPIEFKSKLLDHQKEHLRFHLTHPHSANWSEMGTGKTVTALKYAATLANTGLVERILVLCPLSVFHTWEIEVKKHTNFSALPLIGDLKDKLELLKEPADINIISYDSIPGRKTKGYDTYGIMMGALLNKRFDLLIGDEVTLVKGYGTLRTRAVTILCDKTPYTLFLSGTPISNNPSDVFNLYRALDGGKTFGKNFFATRNKFFENVGYAYPKWILRENMKGELQNRMYLNAVRVRKDDCLDLPPKIFSPRFCYLTDEQRKYYIPIAQDLIKTLQLDGGKIKIQNAMSKIIKLSQITSGFLYTDDKTFYMQENPKADLVENIVKENPNEKIIIYCYWQEDVKILSNIFNKQGYAVGTLYGATPSADRGKVIDGFQKGDLQLLIANITCGGYGLTLTSSSTIIYYNLSFKVIDFLQSQDRIHRHGQAKTCLYLPVLARGSIDEYIYSTIVKNTAVALSIVDGRKLEDSVRRFLDHETY